MVLQELKDVIQSYVDQHDFLSNSAQRSLNVIGVFETGELPKDAAAHNIESIIKQFMPDLTLEEFEAKLRFGEVLNQVLNIIQAE